jgi:hypothetical protein
VKVAPIDAEIIAGTIEDALLLGPDVEDRERAGARASPGDALVRCVDGDDGIDVDER